MFKKGLVVTVLNEFDKVEPLLRSISQQTVKPDEIVIVDAGSTDGTYELLIKAEKVSSTPMAIFQYRGVNIAEGRNIAIKHCNADVIAVTDFGCILSDDWFEQMTRPFFDGAAVVGGIYQRAYPSSFLQKVLYISFNIKVENFPKLINSGNFAQAPPISSRSIAFEKMVWQKVGGYPVYLKKWGEDTLFNKNIIDSGNNIVVNHKAVVTWENERDLRELFKKIRNYTYGDVENCVMNPFYYKSIIRAFLLLSGLTLFFFFWPIGVLLLAFCGFFYVRKIQDTTSFHWTTNLILVPLSVTLFASLDFIRSFLFTRFKLWR